MMLILVSIYTNGQQANKNSIDVAIGYGLSLPYDDIDITATGFYLQGEYAYKLTTWMDVRPYVGLILTEYNEDDDFPFTSTPTLSTNAVLIGGKTQITAPIPWVAPYIEIGIGASFGSFETVTPYTNIDESGVFMHIPLTLGLKLGPKHNFNFAFAYYFHPDLEQFSGATAIGVSFPLN